MKIEIVLRFSTGIIWSFGSHSRIAQAMDTQVIRRQHTAESVSHVMSNVDWTGNCSDDQQVLLSVLVLQKTHFYNCLLLIMQNCQTVKQFKDSLNKCLLASGTYTRKMSCSLHRSFSCKKYVIYVTDQHFARSFLLFTLSSSSITTFSDNVNSFCNLIFILITMYKKRLLRQYVNEVRFRKFDCLYFQDGTTETFYR